MKEKAKKAEIIYSYSFYHEGKEYIIQTTNPNEARTLFYKLLDNK